MINREIIYERNPTGSYMKIPINPDGEFDERMLLRKKLPGVLSVEKTFVNGAGRYWFNISGKQSLDTYCRMKEIGIDFVEKLIFAICNQVEILEWNLIHTDCLMLDPELVFVANDSKEFIFTVYPGGKDSVSKEFRQLMEYIITKVDHKDLDAVHAAYHIYEQTLMDDYSIVSIKNDIIKEKEDKVRQEIQPVHSPQLRKPEIPSLPKEQVKNCEQDWYIRFREKWESLKSFFQKKKESSKEQKKESIIVYPQEQPPVVTPVEHPTVLLSERDATAKGILVYEGLDGLANIHLEGECIHIGKGIKAQVQIDRETISHCHAKIEKDEKGYSIEDLNSKNGTYVNHELLAYKEKRRLKREDVISFAEHNFRFY